MSAPKSEVVPTGHPPLPLLFSGLGGHTFACQNTEQVTEVPAELLSDVGAMTPFGSARSSVLIPTGETTFAFSNFNYARGQSHHVGQHVQETQDCVGVGQHVHHGFTSSQRGPALHPKPASDPPVTVTNAAGRCTVTLSEVGGSPANSFGVSSSHVAHKHQRWVHAPTRRPLHSSSPVVFNHDLSNSPVVNNYGCHGEVSPLYLHGLVRARTRFQHEDVHKTVSAPSSLNRLKDVGLYSNDLMFLPPHPR